MAEPCAPGVVVPEGPDAVGVAEEAPGEVELAGDDSGEDVDGAAEADDVLEAELVGDDGAAEDDADELADTAAELALSLALSLLPQAVRPRARVAAAQPTNVVRAGDVGMMPPGEDEADVLALSS